jgi:cystathionine beta-lyase
MKKDTLLTHAGRDVEHTRGMVNTPVYRTSTVLFPTMAAYNAAHTAHYEGMTYGRYGTPTRFALEQAVAQLEGGQRAAALPSGLAAIVAAINAFVKAGDHLLVADTVYGPTRNFCESRLKPNGVDVTYYEPLIGAGIDALFKPNTRAVFCETPGSLTFEMQDIPAIAAQAHARGIPVLADNTWGTPYFFKSLAHGVDVSIHAATKYIVGHSDVMLGIAVTNERHWEPLRKSVADFGYSVSPDDCYLALRGMRTLGVRLRQQQANALAVAQWLTTRPEVKRVLYPALPGDPGHAIWKRDFEGAASLFGVLLEPVDDDAVIAFIDALKLFGIGASWGGYESLVVRAAPARLRTATRWDGRHPLLRLHVGLEDPEDLIDDLEHGFASMRQAAHAHGAAT